MDVIYNLLQVGTRRYEPENMYFEGEFQAGEEEDEDLFDAVILQRVIRDDLSGRQQN